MVYLLDAMVNSHEIRGKHVLQIVMDEKTPSYRYISKDDSNPDLGEGWYQLFTDEQLAQIGLPSARIAHLERELNHAFNDRLLERSNFAFQNYIGMIDKLNLLRKLSLKVKN